MRRSLADDSRRTSSVTRAVGAVTAPFIVSMVRQPAVLFFFFLMIRRPPRSTLFPYTTLFRSLNLESSQAYQGQLAQERDRLRVLLDLNNVLVTSRELPELFRGIVATLQRVKKRSEEHTSELQSHLNLVCRLLLEKKKKKVAVN